MEIKIRRYEGKFILYSTSLNMYYRHPFWVYEDWYATKYDKDIIDKALKAVIKQELKLEKAWEEAKERQTKGEENVKERILPTECKRGLQPDFRSRRRSIRHRRKSKVCKSFPNGICMGIYGKRKFPDGLCNSF